MKSKEEILKQVESSLAPLATYTNGDDFGYIGQTVPMVEYNTAMGIFGLAMEEYARQSSSLMDEEIKKEGMILEGLGDKYVKGIHYNNDWIDGAKWARDRHKGGKP